MLEKVKELGQDQVYMMGIEGIIQECNMTGRNWIWEYISRRE